MKGYYQMKIILPLGVVLFVSSCCTEANYQKLLNSRLDMNENELIEQVGNPTSVYDTSEKRSLEYKASEISCGQYGCSTRWCTTQYMIKDGKVEKWSYKGNDCCAYK